MLTIPNTTIDNDAYTDAKTFAGNDVFQSGFFTVANNPVFCRLLMGARGLATPQDEVYLPPATYSLQSTPARPVAGLAFRRAVSGSSAQVFGSLVYPNESAIQAGSPFTSVVAASGAVSGATVSAFASITRQALAADVALAATTDTTIISLPVVLPSGGGLVRAVAFWSLMLTNPGAGTAAFDGWVDDQQAGSPFFADGQASVPINTSGGFAMSEPSRNTYLANGQTITFLLRARVNAAGTSIKATPIGGTHGETFLTIGITGA